MIFSDFDNTMMDYYSDKNYFDNYQIDILKKLQDKGIKFCIVSGRGVPFFNQFPNLLGVIDYVIGSNGACVYDVKNKKFIYQTVIQNDVLSQLVDYVVKNNHSFLVNCLDKRYQYGNFNHLMGEQYVLGEEYNCEQMILHFNEKYKDEVVKSLEYFDNIIINNVTNWNGQYSMDINDSRVSKGNSVCWLYNKLGIDIKDTLAFGDGMNDISMFQAVGKNVSVDNDNNDNINKLTDDIALACQDNGVFKYIEENILR